MAATSTDQPEPIRTEFHQMRIVGHEQDGPLPDRQRLDQRLACVDVEMVRRLVEQEDMRRVPRHRREEEARSEEHTSELQSLMRISYAVFCLKKKRHKKHDISFYYVHQYKRNSNVRLTENKKS